MKHLRTIRDEGGFTLVEGMIAGAIATIALMGLGGLQAASFSKNAQSKERTVVTNFGVEMIERIQSNRQRVLDYHNIDTTASTPCPQTTTAQRQALADCQQWRTALAASNMKGVRGTVTASRVDPDPTTGVPSLNRTDVMVTVMWQEPSQSKSMMFRTIIAPE